MATHKFPVSEHTFYRLQYPFKILENKPATLLIGQRFTVHGVDGTFELTDRSFEQAPGGEKRNLILHADAIGEEAIFWVFYRPEKIKGKGKAKTIPKGVYPVQAIVRDGRHPVEYMVSFVTEEKNGEDKGKKVKTFVPVPVRDCVFADNPNDANYKLVGTEEVLRG